LRLKINREKGIWNERIEIFHGSNEKIRQVASGGLEYVTEWTIACNEGFLSVLIPNFRLKKISSFFQNDVKTGSKTREQSPIRGDRSKTNLKNRKTLGYK